MSAELVRFFESYIDAFNALDGEAFARHFHPPVTSVPAPRPDEAGVGMTLPTIVEPSSLLAHLPAHWSRSTIDDVRALGELAPPPPRDGARTVRGPREALVATVTRRDTEDRPYQRIQALYLLSRQDGRLGIKVVAELSTTTLR